MKYLFFSAILALSLSSFAQVGIGTATPTTKLEVVGTTKTDTLIVTRNATINEGIKASISAGWISGNFGIATTADRVVMGNLYNTATIGAHNNALNAWANLSINPDLGNVGIGTFTPTNKLSVTGNVDFSGNVAVGTATSAASAQLDITSTTKGFLPPRMTYAQRNAITGPVAGLIVWCTNCGTTGELQVYNGTAWTNMVGNPPTPPPTPPTVVTTSISGIASTSAASGGTVTADGGSAVTARGICWDIATNPTVALSTKTTNGTGMGSFGSLMTGLTPQTTYFVRAYATNAVGTSYGAELSFTTIAGSPTVITTAISNINSTSAVSGGNVTSDGGSAVTARGVCWDIATNPTVALSTKTSNGAGTGSFVSNITGLTLGTTYYVRAYATNANGTSYGSEFSFTTTLGIGDNYQGGIIAYIVQPGDPGYIAGQVHGLIAPASDQHVYIHWFNGSYVTTGTATALGTGNANTNTIVTLQGAGSYAAKLCFDLVLNTYSDWYLPSKDELNKLYLNQGAIGGFTNNNYWSSSESGVNNAWSQNFNPPGSQNIFSKGSPLYVRAVRAF